MNKLIEMIKVERNYYQQCLLSALDYECYESLVTYYSTILTYIDSLIARMDAQVKED